jgi:hypothetical protein
VLEGLARRIVADRRRYIQLTGLLASFSGAVLPESWASLPMCYCKDDNVEIVRTKDDIEGKSTKDRPAEVSVENLKSVGRNGNDVNQAIQLIQKSNCGTKASLGIPCGFAGVLQRCRMEADRPLHQPLNRVRS